MDMEPLAERELPGYPGASVALYVEERNYAVVLTDPVGVETWKPTTRAEARDMYFHPFVFGYEYSNATNYEGEDGA